MIKNRLFKKEKIGIVISTLLSVASLAIFCWYIVQMINNNWHIVEAIIALIIFISNDIILYKIISGIITRRKIEKAIVKVQQNFNNTDFKKITLSIPRSTFLAYYDEKEAAWLHRCLIVYGGKYGSFFYAKLENNDVIHIVLKEYSGKVVFEDRTIDYIWFIQTFDF